MDEGFDSVAKILLPKFVLCKADNVIGREDFSEIMIVVVVVIIIRTAKLERTLRIIESNLLKESHGGIKLPTFGSAAKPLSH